MRKVFELEDLDCANCAAKMERAIAKVEGVTFVSVNFLSQKMTLEANDETFEKIVDEVVKLCHKVEPDCTIKR